MSQIITSEVLGFAMFTSNVSFQGELKFPDSAQVADHCSLGIRINESTRGRYRNVFRRYQAIITNVNCPSALIRGNSLFRTVLSDLRILPPVLLLLTLETQKDNTFAKPPVLLPLVYYTSLC